MKEPKTLSIGNLVYRISYYSILCPYTVNHVTTKYAYLNLGSGVEHKKDSDIRIPRIMSFCEKYIRYGHNFGDCYASPDTVDNSYVLANSKLNEIYYTYNEINSQVDKKLKILKDVAYRLRTNITEDENLYKLQTLNNLLSSALELENVS